MFPEPCREQILIDFAPVAQYRNNRQGHFRVIRPAPDRNIFPPPVDILNVPDILLTECVTHSQSNETGITICLYETSHDGTIGSR